MITDTLENAHHYPMGPAWDQSFEYIKTLTADTPDGKYPIDGDLIYACVMSYTTQPASAGMFEAHQQYADIQYAIAGLEAIAVADINRLTVSAAYDAGNDVVLFETPSAMPGQVEMHPGTFALFLPQDGHMPKIQLGEPQQIKKVVIKVALSALGL